MKQLVFSKYIAAMICAAIGDALGWPNEQNSKKVSIKQDGKTSFAEWNRKCGGKYWLHEETVCVGEYSDDTQLLLATLRSLLRKQNWGTYFRNVELPAWVAYERGGGGATKRAAAKWKQGISPWDESNNAKEIYSYYMAGGNGVAMRIMPHVFMNEVDAEYIMRQVVLNGMYTHGHPRALIGAMLYAYSLCYIFSLQDTLRYGELIDELISKREVWGKIPEVNNVQSWKVEAQKYLKIDYDILWEECLNETIEYLYIAKEGSNQGVLDIGNEVLERLGCFNRKINGAGNVCAVISVYLFSKYAANPLKGLLEATSLKNADTDTLGSMVGALLGALHGIDWIPLELRIVQDYEAFGKLIQMLADDKEIFDEKQQYKLFDVNQVCNLEVGEKTEVLPFGKLELVEVRTHKVFTKNMYARTYICRTEYGQSIFAKKIGRLYEEKQKVESDVKDKTEQGLFIEKQMISELADVLCNVKKTEDFVEIITSLMTLCESNKEVDNEIIAMYKQKWKKYKLSKKQLDKVCALLKKGSIRM